MPARNFVTSSTSGNFPRSEILELDCFGRSAIKRVAILPGSRCAGGPSGSDAINEANLWVAVSRGTRANSAASCHGSMSNHASAESTLSGPSFPPSPIGANRKSLNSDARAENEVRVISDVEARTMHGTYVELRVELALLSYYLVMSRREVPRLELDCRQFLKRILSALTRLFP
jgi:hypothetical protein